MQFLNADCPIAKVAALAGRDTVAREVHPEKAEVPTLVSDVGKAIDAREVQSANAKSPIDSRMEGVWMETVLIAEQPWKAAFPTAFTLAGMVMVERLVQLEKADSGISTSRVGS